MNADSNHADRRASRTRRAGSSGGRLLLVSNRLPVAVRVERGELIVAPSAGGLVTGMRAVHDAGEGLWIGWPGETWRLTPEQRADVGRRLEALRVVPVELSQTDVRRYYDDFSNGILWPLLHYQLERLPTDPLGWDAYRRVNERFADAVVERYRPGDVVWVHDYQLMLVPGLVRRRLPDASIAFFLHVPFPSSEVFRVLRWRRELLEGILGATLVGLHTASYAGHLVSAAARILGCEVRRGRIRYDGRWIRVGGFPMGIDASQYAALAEEPSVLAEAARVRDAAAPAHVLVAIDRLDYTKGIPRRLLAFERTLERFPSLRGRLRLIQVAAPSRETVGAYREFGRSVDELVGRINGRFATISHQPVHYISRTLPPERLAALFRAASVALVTPLRDGMNLVAKEFVATRTDDDGVLVLSEFAGAAAELSGALLVNPYDLDSVAEAIRQAVEMPVAERRERMLGLRARVFGHDVHRWAREFVDALAAEEARGPGAHDLPAVDGTDPDEILARIPLRPRRLALILDYDGTLVPFRARPDEARPDDEVLRLLNILAGVPGVTVHVVSGRRRAELEAWLGHLPLGLHAEHGLWSRRPGVDEWHRRVDAPPAWFGAVRPALEARVRAVPGSMVEEKEASLVWHYREADDAAGARAARQLRRELEASLSGADAAVVPGARIVEVRQAGLHKGLVVDEARAEDPGAALVVIGDDTTDEDMFAAAPDDAVTIRVGPGETRARYRLVGPDQVRALLAEVYVLRETAAID